MCFITKQTEPKIATEDIEVWKALSSMHPYRSIYYRFDYTPEVLFTTEIKESLRGNPTDHVDQIALIDKGYHFFGNTTGWNLLGEGFHSFETKARLIEGKHFNQYTNIVKCTIPKGAEYYHDRELYISNQIIVHKIE